MKPLIFSILWFIAIFAALSIVELFVLGFIISSIYHPIGVDAGVQAGVHFAKAHAVALNASRIGIAITAFLIAIVGSFKGLLPGTRKTAR